MSYCKSLYVMWPFVSMFIIHFTMPKKRVAIPKNKRLSQDNIRQWPICNGQETICFHGQLFSTNTFYFLTLQQAFLGDVKMDGKPNPHKTTSQ